MAVKNKFVITGGGTGGHIYPGIAIARAILDIDPETRIIFIGGKGQRESIIVPKSGFEFMPILVQSFPRNLSLRWLKVFVKVPMGFFTSISMLSDFKPNAVIATGGYVCGPVALAAILLRIPVLIQEQNAFPGITNRILGRWVDEIHIPFIEASKYFPPDKIHITGNPIRPEITTAIDSREKLGLDMNKLTVTFLGGSQGAKSINSAVLGALDYLKSLSSEIQIIHQTGEFDFPRIKEAYSNSTINALVQPFFYSLEEIYASSDLVICRSGAMTLAEITARGLPAILVPYPYAAGDHQTFNARVLEDKGAAIMIKDNQLTGEFLAKTITDLIKDKQTLNDMSEKSLSLGKPYASKDIARAAFLIIKKGKIGLFAN